MLLIGPLPNAGDLGVINLYLVMHLIGTERSAGADEDSDDNNGGQRRVPHWTDGYHPALSPSLPTLKPARAAQMLSCAPEWSIPFPAGPLPKSSCGWREHNHARKAQPYIFGRTVHR